MASTMPSLLSLLLLLIAPLMIRSADGYLDCFKEKIQFDDRVHKQKYRIAVHAIRGFETALRLYNQTFENYLTATAGQRFDPPIEFELVPVDFNGLIEQVEVETVDFIYANPGSYSCVGMEQGAQPLVTTISEVTVRGHTYDLDVFGGVIFTRADNKDIQTIHDLKDKIIGAGDIGVIMGGQTQLYEMVKAGMNYVMDPKQVVFTHNQFEVVSGVLKGDFDVGMVRTDQIERSLDDEGNPIDSDVFKILEPKIHVLDNGHLFPFLHSTEIFPEWPVAALTFVPADVSIEVQAALLALSEHAQPWEQVIQCEEELLEGVLEGQGSTITIITNKDADTVCDEVFWNEITRCDTTPDLARLAYHSSQNGGISGFRSPRSYFDVRAMHQRAGFALQDEETGKWHCIRDDSLQDSLTCPPEHYKLSKDDFEESCSKLGLTCAEGHDCYCKPCVKAFEVDVYQYFPEGHRNHKNASYEYHGCDKMNLCGRAEQRETILLRAFDNKKRTDATVIALVHEGDHNYEVPFEQLSDYTYQLEWSDTTVGDVIVEVSVNGEQIPESPFRLEVTPRSCNLEGGGSRVPDEDGDCVCAGGDISIGSNCVTSAILAVVISIVALMLVIVVGYFVIQHKNYKNDLVWHVNADELQFDDPVQVIGEGAFGVVLLAEYRGTKVAIKRALKSERKSWKSSLRQRGSEIQGTNGLTSTGSLAAPRRVVRRVSMDHSADTFGSESEDTPTTGGSVDVEAQLGVPTATASLKNSRNKSASMSQSRNASQGRPRGGKGTGFQYRGKASVVLDLGFLDKHGKRGKSGGKVFVNEKFQEAALRSNGKSRSSSSNIMTRSFAAKLCPWFDEQAKREEEFIAEMRLLSSLRHPCICTVMGAVVARDYVPMLVMEYMEYGSLHDLLRNETMFITGEIILQIVRDVAHGLQYLHHAKPPILHGDLKPANILIDNRFRAKVCDFGLSRKKKNTISGSLFWLAPEYLSGSDDYTPACDMYSMAIILNEAYSRKTPYAGEDADLTTLLSEVCDRRVNKRPVMAKTIPPKMGELVKKLWSRDPTARPQARDLDAILMDMNVQDAEPLTLDQMNAKPRTEDMLYELFPRHIAEALKAGKKVEPENHELVTIVFSDIRGFTDISEKLPALKVSMMLDRLYLAFDKIARKHHVFKVETIGDAYMGVTNIVEKQEDTHVKCIAEFAVDMINEASQILVDEEDPSKGYIHIRVGFHSGPVVSNVIGSLNPRYGLFGDTVNTASRMESNSDGSRILCSEASYMLLKRQAPEMPVHTRGTITVKGKGNMSVYWVGDKLVHQNKKALRQSRARERTAKTKGVTLLDHHDEHTSNPDLSELCCSLASHEGEVRRERRVLAESSGTESEVSKPSTKNATPGAMVQEEVPDETSKMQPEEEWREPPMVEPMEMM